MIIADKFVYIHYPKTGGTFVTKILEKIHEGKGYKNKFSRKAGRLFGKTGGGILDTKILNTKHGGCREIPPSFRGRAIVSTVRNPFDHYVSEYEFGWWKKYPEVFYDANEAKKAYPNFEDASFAEYVEMRDRFFHLKVHPTPKLKEDNELGCLSYKFINLFFKQPLEKVLLSVDEDYIADKKYKAEMFPVHFLRMENLNEELYDFLVAYGYKPEELQFILDSKKVLPKSPTGGPRQDEKWEKYYTPELKNFVRKRERLLFSLFPEYDI